MCTEPSFLRQLNPKNRKKKRRKTAVILLPPPTPSAGSLAVVPSPLRRRNAVVVPTPLTVARGLDHPRGAGRDRHWLRHLRRSRITSPVRLLLQVPEGHHPAAGVRLEGAGDLVPEVGPREADTSAGVLGPEAGHPRRKVHQERSVPDPAQSHRQEERLKRRRSSKSPSDGKKSGSFRRSAALWTSFFLSLLVFVFRLNCVTTELVKWRMCYERSPA